MKHNIFTLLFPTLFLIGASSCSDWLEVLPENEMVLEQYWQTESDAQDIVTACYRGMIENDVTYRMLIWGEMRSDNLTEADNTDYYIHQILNQEITPTNINTNWASFYAVINNCNTFLVNAPQVLENDANYTVEKLHAMEAEVLTIRALCYFYLVRAFEKVPYITVPSIDDSQDFLVPQSEERAVLDSIVGDLKIAAQYAKAKFSTNTYTKGLVTKNAVYALLADIYLWDEQYAKCMEMCDLITTDNSLVLVTADNVLKKVFYEGNSTESIFELQFDDDVQINYATRNLYGYADNVIGDVSFPSNLTPGQLYSPFKYSLGNSVYEGEKDIRAKDWFVTVSSLGINLIFKYSGLSRVESSTGTTSSYTYRTNTSNLIVYRLSDIILMKAEAMLQLLNKQGKTESKDLDDVVALVNKTYRRSNPDADTLYVSRYSSFTDVQNLVLRERQRELMFEGKRWFDLMRLARRANSPTSLIGYVAKTTSGNEALGKMSTMNALYWPVYKDELEANSLLKQNPFYETVNSTQN